MQVRQLLIKIPLHVLQEVSHISHFPGGFVNIYAGAKQVKQFVIKDPEQVLHVASQI